LFGEVVGVQVAPEFVDLTMTESSPAANNLLPSPEQATDVSQEVPGGMVPTQSDPEFVEVKIVSGPPYSAPTAATRTFPSDEDATQLQLFAGASVRVQSVPEFVDM
jgi:hypothetical protein